jgi:hypothetical protein
MLENLLIVDATMIVGILFVEAIGRSFEIRAWSMGRWMLLWGFVALLPFSVSSILALIGNELAIASAVVGFVGFTAWFILMSSAWAFGTTMEEKYEKVVEEKDLEKWLQKNWRVVTVLQSGRVVIEY